MLSVTQRRDDGHDGQSSWPPVMSMLVSRHVEGVERSHRRRRRRARGRPSRRDPTPDRATRTRRQGVDRRAAVMVVLLATDLVPPVVASLGAAGALILLGVVTIEQTYRAIAWTTVILVAGMMPLSTAMRTTGAAEQLAEPTGRHRRRLRAVPAADRAVRPDRGARSADQQHGDRADRDPGRAVGGGRTRRRRRRRC